MHDTQLVRRILRVYRSATPDQVDAGVNWYSDCYGIAHDIGARHMVAPVTVAGIIAALSPMQSFGANILMARRFVAQGGLTSGYLPGNLVKAQRILDGERPMDVLGGDKVTNFYLSIIGCYSTVCVDRHAYDLAHGIKGHYDQVKITPKRYRLVADSYVRAAAIAGIAPVEMQAITWVTWRNRYYAEGAFDPKDA